MTPNRLRECLTTLGLTARGLARMTGRQDGAGPDWLIGRYAVPANVAAWLERAMEWHLANPPPQTSPRRARVTQSQSRV